MINTSTHFKTFMRVLHVITGLGSGGAEGMLLKLLSARPDGWEPAVVSLGETGVTGSKISELNIPVYALNLNRRLPNPIKLLSIVPLVRHLRPHIIHGWMPHGNLMALLAAMSLPDRVPVLWNIRMSLYNFASERGITPALIRFCARLSRFPNKIVYNSEVGARQHEALGYRSAKSVIIPNGFDCRVFHPSDNARREVRAELKIKGDALLVGFIARYDPMKDHANFLRAARLIVRQYSDVYFVLAGPGMTADNPTVLAMIAAEGLEGCIFLLGERADIPRLTAALDIACSASWSEGFPNTVGEAMACAVPCVVTEVGDTGYLVSDTGLKVPPRCPTAMAEAVVSLISGGVEYRRQLGITARQRVESEFSLPVVAQRYDDLYRDLLQRNSH